MDTNTNPPLTVLSGAPEKQHRSAARGAKALRIAAAALISLLGALILAARVNPGRMDYIEYWSSAHLLIHRANPYSPAGVLALEKVHGFAGQLIMLNPPWTLFLVAPLGVLGVHTGLILWTLVAGGCILGSVRLLDPGSQDWLLALLFAPAIACFGSGQSSPFLLLGCTLFLYFHHNRPFAAGAALLLMAIKPHLFLVFWAVLLADCIYRRNFLVLAGLASALAAATAFAMLIDPRMWPHYLETMLNYQLQQAPLPTTSMLFRKLINPHAFWLLFVPSAVAVLWGLWYFWRLRHAWDWRVHGMLVMLVTVLVSPYGFFTDEVVLLPSIIFALNFAGKRKYSGWILLAINGIAALVFMAGASLASSAYLWTPLAWLAWFLYATYFPGHRDESTAVRLAATAQTGQVG